VTELRAASERFECVIESADFDTDTVTLKMTGKYHVAAGPWVLCRPEVAALAAEQPKCPRPTNSRPDDWTQAACIAAGECGCGALAAGQRSAAEAAIRTLRRLRYTWHGGELWKPPLGSPPVPAEQPQPVIDAVRWSQFLSDVLTAAGLLSHGMQSKAMAARIGFEAMALRLATLTPPPAAEPSEVTDAQAKFCAALMDRPAVYCGRAQGADDEVYEASFTFDTAEKVERVWKAYTQLEDALSAAAKARAG
jgi:hypothetical protein